MKNRLNEIRTAQNVSQEKLAVMLNVSQKTVSSWEIGRTTPKPSQMQHLEDVFNVPKEEIFFTAFNYKNELNENKEVV
ncbi:helix-turn-helix transcriptional regulator [Enterococcus avium]|uniref:helix-turn-helix transcriptional regulator n=1 Tax=Enterococcus avium TaxID=33945 RepID=UPI002891BB0E|nr:helix-turn-helix transcriptional regulator [Enterococcus avium]MDT2493406.1 helix-turn-helix transcriptional regulator [Enterococcus avium]